MRRPQRTVGPTADAPPAYALTIGKPYGGWGISAVLKVFAHLANTPTTWQKQICEIRFEPQADHQPGSLQ